MLSLSLSWSQSDWANVRHQSSSSSNITSNSSILHVEMQRGQAFLQWHIDQKKIVRSLKVQHSEDGRRFSTLCNSDLNHATHYLHERPIEGTNHYRLRVVYFDGSRQVSDVKLVRAEDDPSEMHVFPNPTPASAAVSVFVPEEMVNRTNTFVLRDQFQHKVLEWDEIPQRSLVYLDLSKDLQQGMYDLHLTSDNGKSITRKLMIN